MIGNGKCLSGNGASNRGGKCVQGQGQSILNVHVMPWFHPDVVESVNKLVSSAMEKVELKKASNMNSAT